MTRAVRFHQTGGPEVLQFDDVQVASPQSGEVQIRVKALGINRAEVMYRTGKYVIDPQFPAKLGYEASGEVVAVGANVTGFATGDLVSVIPAFSFAEYGMYGEVVNAPGHAVVKNPANVTHEEAAATWMMFVTAYGALINYGKLTSADTVIIGAATSSVGLAAIQVAKMVGAKTVALTRSAEKEGTLRACGADHVLLSDMPDLTEYIVSVTGGKGARIVFDPVGGPNARNILRAMSHGGIYYQYGALDSRDIPVPVMDILTKHLVLQGYELFEITQDAQKLEQAKAFISEGLSSRALRPVIDRVFRFEEIAEAHRYMEAGNQVGKIVVTL
ncbi:zinc-dependent alcohol dehydrogenase family protein [Paraburkholderia terrae]|uniref:NADPH:quinone reductase n=1 Tax=Paraburkholderia terrae TaxID=311230 RepID=A0ABM7TMQ2_9BURK|nr:zinc-dependent alcohol dehydrogenase family protein [Paraburkholderia terrae]BCZ79481.1 NADPH:quinone reductase [Paraburkholderia terrae]BDC42048.1 NADPH:quinone reductase [Paraburkholderia terrae]